MDHLKEALKAPLDSMPLMACVQSWMREVEIQNATQISALAKIEHLESDNKMLIDILKAHGEHLDVCNYIEEVSSGRILKDDEETLCDCGWCEVEKMLDKRATEGDSSLEPVAK